MQLNLHVIHHQLYLQPALQGGLVTGFGAAVAVPLGFVSVASGCICIFMGIFDQKVLNKMKKHSKLVQLAATMNSEII